MHSTADASFVGHHDLHGSHLMNSIREPLRLPYEDELDRAFAAEVASEVAPSIKVAGPAWLLALLAALARP